MVGDIAPLVLVPAGWYLVFRGYSRETTLSLAAKLLFLMVSIGAGLAFIAALWRASGQLNEDDEVVAGFIIGIGYGLLLLPFILGYLFSRGRS